MANNISKSQAEGLQAKVNAKNKRVGVSDHSGDAIPYLMGRNKGKAKKDAKKDVKIVLAKNRPIGLRYIEKQLALAGFVVVTEYEFAKPRKYRADISVNVFSPKGLQHILIEYEGLVSSKSRHTTLTGYTKDCDKYNIATSLGYKVYRYTALNYKNIHELIKSLV
jgi:hypothetical protein